MDFKRNDEQPALQSYQALRKTVGVLGIVLPVILVIGSIFSCQCNEIQVSISNYYHTCMRNIFVGILCSVGLFMFWYKGYDWRDDLAGHLAGIFAFGIAWLPTSFKGDCTCLIKPASENPITGYLHLASALSFFLVLIYFSLVLFTQSGKGQITNQKKKRNLVYKVCGYVMLACILIIVVYVGFLRKRFPVLDRYDIVFWLETISLWAFGTSWLVKGGALLKDVS